MATKHTRKSAAVDAQFSARILGVSGFAPIQDLKDLLADAPRDDHPDAIMLRGIIEGRRLQHMLDKGADLS